MLAVLKSATYNDWFEALRDRQARARIEARVDRLLMGNPGDVKPAGEGVSELRIDYGPGYRVYFALRGNTTVLLLGGGDKRTQNADIKQAIKLLKSWR
jgi:putative addiction module killer protein